MIKIQDLSSFYIEELKEFANFSPSTQRYICRSLDLGEAAPGVVERWSRNPAEAASVRAQQRAYRRLEHIIDNIPDDNGLHAADPMLAPLVAMTAFDLGQGRLESFGAFRFLYERLIGPEIRPWLPVAYCAAATLPYLHPDHRGCLLSSISKEAATAPGWSRSAPRFFPGWVDK
jgi:hypothetical protein